MADNKLMESNRPKLQIVPGNNFIYSPTPIRI